MPISIVRCSISLLTACFLCACESQVTSSPKNALVFSSGGNSLQKIEHLGQENRVTPLYKNEKGVSTIAHITAVSKEQLAFDECRLGKCEIKLIDLNNNQVTTLGSGHLPAYVANHSTLFFYDTDASGQAWLYRRALGDENAQPQKVLKAPAAVKLANGVMAPVLAPPVSLEDDRVIVLDENHTLQIYNLKTSELSKTTLKDCIPTLYRRISGQLMCTVWNSKTPFWLNLDSTERQSITDLAGGFGFIYNPEHDIVNYGRTRNRMLVFETNDVYEYSPGQNKSRRLAKNVRIAAGVWLP